MNMRRFPLYTVLLLTFLCQSACQPNAPLKAQSLYAGQVSFEALCGVPLEKLMSMDEDQARKWVEGNGGLTVLPGKTYESQYEGSQVIFRSASPNKVKEAVLYEGKLVFIEFGSFEDGPSFGQIVSWLGEPETIDRTMIRFEKFNYSLFFDYPDQGISVGMDKFADYNEVNHERQLAIQLTRNIQITFLFCYPPKNSLEQVLSEVYRYNEKGSALSMTRRIPWPGFGAWISLDNIP